MKTCHLEQFLETKGIYNHLWLWLDLEERCYEIILGIVWSNESDLWLDDFIPPDMTFVVCIRI